MIVVSLVSIRIGKLNVTLIMIVVSVKFVTIGAVPVTDQPTSIVSLVILVITANHMSILHVNVYQTVQLVI